MTTKNKKKLNEGAVSSFLAKHASPIAAGAAVAAVGTKSYLERRSKKRKEQTYPARNAKYRKHSFGYKLTHSGPSESVAPKEDEYVISEETVCELIDDLDMFTSSEFEDKYHTTKSEAREMLREPLKQTLQMLWKNDEIDSDKVYTKEEALEMYTALKLFEGEMNKIQLAVSEKLPRGHIIHGLVMGRSTPNYAIVKTAHKKELYQVKYHHLIRDKKTGEWKHAFMSSDLKEEVENVEEGVAGKVALAGAGFIAGVGVEGAAQHKMDSLAAQKGVKTRKKNERLAMHKEEVIALDELSKALLARYVNKAQPELHRIFFQGEHSELTKWDNRFVGVKRARKKLGVPDMSKPVEEGLASHVATGGLGAMAGYGVGKKVQRRRDVGYVADAVTKGQVLIAPQGTRFQIKQKEVKYDKGKVAEEVVVTEGSVSADAYSRIDGYKKMGFKVGDVSVKENHAEYTVTDKEGNRRRHILKPNSRKVEDLGSVQVDSDDDDEQPKKVMKKAKKKKFKTMVKKKK